MDHIISIQKRTYSHLSGLTQAILGVVHFGGWLKNISTDFVTLSWFWTLINNSICQDFELSCLQDSWKGCLIYNKNTVSIYILGS